MNAKKAKALRRAIVASKDLQPSYEDLLSPRQTTGEIVWDRTCQRGMYREMKKLHRKNKPMIVYVGE